MRRRQQKFKSRLRLLTDRSDIKHRKKKTVNRTKRSKHAANCGHLGYE